MENKQVDKNEEICANCNKIKGAHRFGYDYCPGDENQMNWDDGPGTYFKSTGQYKLKEEP